MRHGWVAAAACAMSLVASASAHADRLSSEEMDRLRRGGTIARLQTVEHHDRRYVGGVTYTVFDATAGDVTALVNDLEGWRRFLPKTRDAHLVGVAGGDALVEVTHGSALVQVSYTMRVHREGNVVRFWLDANRPHDIEDLWGFFRAEPFDGGRALVTYGILIDIGAGLLRDLFEDRVRELALSVPQRARGVLRERRTAWVERPQLVTSEAAARY
jgi:hypothetical protein